MKKSYPIDFRVPETVGDLCSYIGVNEIIFRAAIDPEFKRECYFPHRIPKRSPHRADRFRLVWEVVFPHVAEAHKAIARRFDLFARLADSRFPHSAAYGYVRHRGTRENAGVHCGARLLLRADLRNFFPSITIERVEGRFLELGMQPEAAGALAQFVTIDGRLPLGLNASPMLANLVCVDLDVKIEKLAMAHGCRYTRYADDISISGKRKLPSREELEKIIKEEGFELSHKKFRVTKIGQAHYVTGLSVSDADGGPHVPRWMKRRLRTELFFCKKFGIRGHLSRVGEPTIQAGVNRLDGYVHYVSHIEVSVSKRLKSEWKTLLARDNCGPSHDTREVNSHINVTCYVDESEIELGNKRCLALCLAFTEDANAMMAETIATLREHTVSDAFYAGDKSVLRKRGLHFADSHPDLRTAYIKRLANLSYRSFVIFGELKDDKDYEKTYAALLQKILPKRLMWYDGVNMQFIFEQNSKVTEGTLSHVVDEAYASLESSKSRRPLRKPEVSSGKKLENPCFSVPDYLLAVFSRFAQFNLTKKPEEVRRHQFERLRDKYRLIVDADSGVEYSRRRPFIPWAPPAVKALDAES